AVEREPLHHLALDVLEALARLDEVAGEDVPPLLAVGDDVDAGPLLRRDGLVDRAVLQALQLGAGRAPRPRFEQPGRPQQAADVVGAEVGHTRTSSPVSSARSHAFATASV